MKRLSRKVREMLSFFLAAVMLVLSVPQTVLSVEAKAGGNTGIVSEMTGEDEETPDSEEISEGAEGSTGTGETSEGAEEGSEAGESTEGAEEGSEENAGAGENTECAEEGSEAGENTEGTEEDAEAGENTEGTDEDDEAEEITEEDAEESIAVTAAETDEQEDITLEVGVKFTVEYEDYTLGFTIREKDYAWYAELSSFTNTSDASKLRYEVTIPSYVRINAERKLPVTEILASVFKGQTKISKVFFEEDPQLVKINGSAFKDCINLAYIEWPDTLTYIGESAFSGDTLLGSRDENDNAIDEPCLTFPDSVTTIGQAAFEKCNAYKSIVIPQTFKKVDGNSIYTIYSPFRNSTGIKDVYFEEGMETIPNNLFNGVIGNKDDSVTFHMADSLTAIGDKAFMSQTYLTRVEFGENTQLTTIGKSAFESCTNLTYINFPDTLTNIGESAFSGDALLGSYDKDGNKVAVPCLTFPESVTAVGQRAFEKCNAYKSVVIPQTLKTVSGNSIYTIYSPFYNCTGIEDIYIEEGIEEILPNLFYGVIGQGAGSVNYHIPDSVTTIGKSAFASQTNLTGFELGENSGLTTIESYAFEGCSALKFVYLPNSVTTMGSHVFKDCKALETIILPDSVTKIGEYAFDGCKALKSIRLPDALTKMERGFCRNNTKLEEVILGENTKLASIGENAFEKCTSLSSFTFPATLQTIWHSAFTGCTALTEVVIPVSVTHIYNSAFNGCTSLQKIEFEVNNYYTHKQELGEGVFGNCTSLNTIKFGNKIQAIPNKAFSGCTALEELEIPYGVTSIGSNAFYNCHELKCLFIPSSVTTIKTTQNELAFCYEQGLKIYVEKGESAVLTWADKIGFETEVGIYRTREEFPDEAFFMEMNTQRFDKNLDTRLTLRELEQINTLELSKLGISDMTGIQILTYVESLNCSENRITVLDTSALTLLKTLNCANNKISVLDVSNNPLETLNCENNAILVIDLSGITTLKEVTLGEQAGSLAINYDSAYGEYVLPLKEIYSAYNKACISEPSDEDVNKPTNNGLVWYKAYDVPDNISYKYTTEYGSESGKATANVHVTITNAGITLTDKEYPDAAFRGKVMELVDTNQNGLISKTEERSCSELQISGADIIDLTGLDRLSSLRILNCADNHLKTLDISRNPALEILDCSKNELKELNTQSNLSLKELTCTDNKITGLDTSQNTLLEILECGNNRIAVIEAENNKELDTLRSGNQNITVVKTVTGDSAYIDLKAYDERFDYAKATGITMYLDNTAIKDADVKISGDGIVVPNYVEQISYQYSIPNFREMYVTVKIVEKLEEEPEEEPARNISTLTISAFTDKIYTGDETTQVITIYDGNYRLRVYKDYTVAYKNNIEVGTASVTIKGIGKYIGTYMGNYEIKPEWGEISIKNIPDQVYQNKEITPALTVKLGKKVLEKDRDFVADYSNNKDAGVATIVITGIGQYESAGMREISFNIVECNISKATFMPIADEIYDGTEKVPVPVVHHNGLLRAGIDYTMSYSKNIKAGKGVITVKGIGNYTGTVKKTFTIKKYDLSKLTNEEILVEQTVLFSMTGAKAAVEIKTSSGITLTEGTDYTLSYSGNKKAGVTDAKVVIKGKGSCSGKKTMTFEVTPQSLNDAALQIKIAVAQKDSKGRQIKPNITITQNNKKLREGENKDYTVTYNAEDTVRSGKVTVTITGKNNYGGETTADFIIVDKLITKAKIKGIKNYEYSGEEIEQSENDITVMIGKEEVPVNCYDISYDQNIESGNKAVMTVTANPENCNYEFGGSVTAKFKITPVKFALSKTENRVEASLAKSTIVYNGQKQSPDVIVTDELSNIVLKKDVDYVASYSNNQNVGTKGKVTIKGKGNYSGTIVIPFSIEAKNMTEYEDDFTVIMRNSAYTGKKISPRITVMDGDTVLKLNKDYKLEIEKYDSDEFDGKIKDRGRYIITIKGAGNYTGELSEYNLYVY